MVANVTWNFTVTVTQEGGSFTGSMYGTNPGDGTTTPIRGTVSQDGTILFTRTFAGVVQTYRGKASTEASGRITMTGTFTQSNDNKTYGWSASKAPSPKKIELTLTYPVGKSPKVFTDGWVFGAQCIVKGQKEEDLSSKVEWSGSGRFRPAVGNQSKPTFNGPGKNTITLTCAAGTEKVKKDFEVEAVSPENYAHVGSLAFCPADSHGCPACPHAVLGEIIAGSPLVMIKRLPAARKGDPGVHVRCCGPNTFTVDEGDPEVIIDGKPAARIGDRTKHCGGTGTIVTTAPQAPPRKDRVEWDRAKWRDIVCREEDPNTSAGERSRLLDMKRAERLRLLTLQEHECMNALPGVYEDSVKNPAVRRYIREMRQRDRECHAMYTEMLHVLTAPCGKKEASPKPGQTR